MAKNSSNILALGVGLNLDPLNQDIANAAKTAKEGMATLGQSVVDGGAKASGATEKLGDKVQTMRQQLRLATQDAQAMAEKYGIMSTQAIASASRAGELKDKIGDINTVITAFSADSKFTVVAGAMQSAAGAASIVTGAMGLLGTESKATQEMLLKVQSALALTQGLAQIKEMGASFTALNAVIVRQVIPGIAAMSAGLLLATGGAVLIIGAIAYAVNEYRNNLQKNEQQLALNAQREREYAEAIRNSKQELVQKTIALRDELTALKEGVTIDEVQIRNKEAQVSAFNALIKQYKDHNDKIREDNALKTTRLKTENALIALVGGQKKTEADLGIIQEKNTQGLEAKVQLLKDEIEQGRIQLGLTKEIGGIELANKNKIKSDQDQSKAALALAKQNYKDLAEINKNISTRALINAFAGPKDITSEKDANGLNAPKFIEITYKIKSKIDTQELEASIKQSIKNVENAINTAMEQMAVRTISILSQAIGSAVGGMKDPFHNLGWILLQSIGTIMVQLGEAVLAVGIGMLGLDMALKSLNPFVAIAAGALLIAGGAALNAVASNGIGGGTVPAPAPAGGGGNNSALAPNSNYIGGQNSGQLVIQGYVRGNDINFVNGKSGSKNNRNLRFG